MLIASRLLLCEHQRRLRLIDLSLACIDLRMLHGDLGVDVLDGGLRGVHLRLRLVQRDAVIAVIDAGDHAACGDVLVVGDGNLSDVARHFGRDGNLARRDEGVVGRLKMFGVIEVEVSCAHHGGCNDRPQGGRDRAAAQEALAGLAGFVRRLGILFPLRLLFLDGGSFLARRSAVLRLLAKALAASRNAPGKFDILERFVACLLIRYIQHDVQTP